MRIGNESSPAGALETPSEVALQERDLFDGVLPWPEDEREWCGTAGSYEPSEPSIAELMYLQAQLLQVLTGTLVVLWMLHIPC